MVEGGSGGDTLVGNQTYDSDLYGGTENDVLIAKTRVDYLDGGTGTWDVAYVFADRYWVVNIDNLQYH